LMYTELSDMGADLPPMAPFAVRESSLAIGRSSGPEHRGGYTQPEERIGIKRIAPNETDHDSGSSSSSGPNGSTGSVGFDGSSGSTGANGTGGSSGSNVPKGPQVSSCSLGARLGPAGHSGPAGPLGQLGQWGQLGQSGPTGQFGQWGQWGRGAIAPVSPMVTLGANMPLAVFVVLVLNALMMLLCAVALLSRGGRSA
jgi:hypothetical protein